MGLFGYREKQQLENTRPLIACQGENGLPKFAPFSCQGC